MKNGGRRTAGRNGTMELTPEVLKQIDTATRTAFREESAALEVRIAEKFKTSRAIPAADLAGADELARRRTQPSRHGRGYDVHEGKGLDFVRFVKAHAVARTRGTDPARVAEAWGYKRVAEVIEAGLRGGMSHDAFTPEQRAVAMTESVMADGGAIVPDEFSSEFIELLRPATVVRASGARVVPMNSGTLSMGRQNSAGTASYQGETENIAPSKLGVGQLAASAKKLTALTPISNDLIRDNAISAEALVRDDLIAVMARKEDITFIRALGTQYQPKGILYWTADTNKFDATQDGAVATVAEVTADLARLLQLVDESDVNVDLASAAGTVGWIMTPRSKWFLFGMVNEHGVPVFRDELRMGKLWNHPVRTTTQIPNTLGSGSDESEVYFGIFDQAIIAENTNLIVDAFPGGAYHDGTSVVSGISADQTVIRTIARHDFLVRHNNCFAVLEAVRWGAV
jgi:HK97 family phage major capsid protein